MISACIPSMINQDALAFRIGVNAIGRIINAKTPPVALSASSVVSTIRGGAIDVDRSLIRLDALDAYPVVAAILMAAMMDMNTDTPKVMKRIHKEAKKSTSAMIVIENIVTCLFSLVNSFSIAAATYSTVVFTLVVIYSKTALGMELDNSFLSFFAATANLRESAFHAFFYSMVGFVFSLSLSRFLRESGIFRYIESIPMLIASVIGIVHYKYIMGLATSYIFSGDVEILI